MIFVMGPMLISAHMSSVKCAAGPQTKLWWSKVSNLTGWVRVNCILVAPKDRGKNITQAQDCCRVGGELSRSLFETLAQSKLSSKVRVSLSPVLKISKDGEHITSLCNIIYCPHDLFITRTSFVSVYDCCFSSFCHAPLKRPVLPSWETSCTCWNIEFRLCSVHSPLLSLPHWVIFSWRRKGQSLQAELVSCLQCKLYFSSNLVMDSWSSRKQRLAQSIQTYYTFNLVVR